MSFWTSRAEEYDLDAEKVFEVAAAMTTYSRRHSPGASLFARGTTLTVRVSQKVGEAFSQRDLATLTLTTGESSTLTLKIGSYGNITADPAELYTIGEKFKRE